MLALMGKSGSGKSTVLNIISGIDGLQKGSYRFKNQEMAKVRGDKMTVFRRDNIGFVLQHFALIEDATIYDNIALPLRLCRKPKSEIKERVRKLAVELGIEKQLNKYPKELSGGEAQRTAIARAIINQPKLILADEPTGALDEENSRKIMEIFQKLNAQGNTFIIVTHDPNVGVMCKRTVYIKDGKNYKSEGGEFNA
jgi:putative ABC transport system ATP-binding protein